MDRTSPHVLIVAAQPVVRFSLEELLRAYGYDVTSVSGVAPEPSDAVLEGYAAVLVASTVPQTDRYGHAPSQSDGLPERDHGIKLTWVPI